MEKSTSLGLVAGIALVFGAIFLGSGWKTFFDPASLLLVMGGTGAALVVNYSFADLRKLPGGVRTLFTFTPPSFSRCIEQFVNLSGTARQEGLLALDRRLGEMDDEFLRRGLEMAVDGLDEEEIADLIAQRAAEEAQQVQVMPKFFITAGTYAPAFGMVGTLIGLIQMLQNLNDPAQIGAGMATAMVTTFYGALLANLIFLPLGEKAKAQQRLDAKRRHVVQQGVLSIARGESPRMIEQRLGMYKAEDAPVDSQVPAGVTEAQAAGMPSMAQAA